MSRRGFGTKAVHAGQAPDPVTGALNVPVYQSATFEVAEPGLSQSFEYGRVSNPTRAALETNLAALEDARHAVAFSSGVAAADAIVRTLRPGDHVLASSDLYGGNFRLLTAVHASAGLRTTFVDMTRLDVVAAALTPSTRLLWLESPTNPLLRVLDVAALSRLARAHGVVAVVDSTFATPYLQQPLALGADLVLHSTSKYLGGHSDVIGGVVCTQDGQWAEKLRFQVKCTGAVPGPMDCFLLLRGIKTLHLRLERQCAGAERIAAYLQTHDKVRKVYYPGLKSSPDHSLAGRQMRCFGAMLSFELEEGIEVAKVLTGVRIFKFAESLGGVESLIGHPATMSHSSLSASERLTRGITDNLVRLSVGVEDVEDLIDDLEQALAA